MQISNLEATIATKQIVAALERIATALEQTALCQKNSVMRSEAMQMASMDGSKVYQRYEALVKEAAQDASGS